MNARPSIALLTMVRNESGRIGRLIRNVRPIVTEWLIIDTGSMDDTQSEIRREFTGTPGHLLKTEWVDFGTNRTLLFETARQRVRADWLLLLDADMELQSPARTAAEVAALPEPADMVLLPTSTEPTYWTPRLLRSSLTWRFEGSTREVLQCLDPKRPRIVKGHSAVVDHADGSARTHKWENDRDLLTAQIRIEPTNARNWFYLGEAYRALGSPLAAAAAYVNAAIHEETRGHVSEMRYVALTAAGEQRVAAGELEEGLSLLLTADDERPQRHEALLAASRALNTAGQYARCVELLTRRTLADAPPPKDLMGVQLSAYPDELTVQLMLAGRAATEQVESRSQRSDRAT